MHPIWDTWLVGLSTEADELPRGSELQAGVRVDLAIIFDPIGEHCKDCVGIMQDVEASVIALEGFDEALRDAVAFGTADRCEEQGQAESARDVGSVLGDVGTSVVGQPVDWMWRACAFEPALDGGDHEIAYHLAGDTGVRHGRPGDDLAVAGIRSDSQSTGCGVHVRLNRRSTAAIMRSRTISPEIPAFATADQAMISRSQASSTNRIRTTSRFLACSSR